jgi:acyl-CoA thioester hydrolase
MGVMYYANYLRIYEGARADFLDKIDLSLTDMINSNVICPVINVNADYLSSAKYDWIVRVVSTVEKVPLAKLVFLQEMYSPDNILLNRAKITLGFVDMQKFTAIRCPEWIKEGFEKHFIKK